jgi:transcriptional regulator with XRE-family HTH domain
MDNETQELAAFEKAQNAMAFIEQLELVMKSLEFLAERSPQERGELEAIIGRVKSLYEMVNEGEAEFDIVASKKTLNDLAPSKIERMGLGREILRLRNEAKLSIKDIAERFSISSGTVSQFLKAYEQAKPSEQAIMRRTSIFDTTEQWERLGARMESLYARVEMSDNQVSVQVLAEFRKTIESAEKFMGKLSDQQKLDQIRQVVQEVLIEELPGKRVQIINKLSQAGLRGQLASSSVLANQV